MEMSQRNSLYSYLKQTKMSFFSFTKSENRRVEKVLPGGGLGTSGRGVEVGKGCGRVNMVQILCAHVCKWKNGTCRNYSRDGEGG
jgi:hypothetical protein